MDFSCFQNVYQILCLPTNEHPLSVKTETRSFAEWLLNSGRYTQREQEGQSFLFFKNLFLLKIHSGKLEVKD